MTQSLHPAAAQGFSRGAALYQQVRPDYPAELIPWLQQQLDQQTQLKLLDIGTGTGKFLPTLLALSSDIIAVDPVAEMLQQLRLKLPDIATLEASSHSLPIADNSIDAIFCAQSFHWFANPQSLDEFARILKPNGHLFLIWNQRDIRVDWVKALADCIATYEGDTPRYHSGQWQQVLAKSKTFDLITETTFVQPHVGLVEDVVSKRLLSTSFIAALPISQQNILKQHFEQTVASYTGKTAQDEIAFPYVTQVYHYQHIVKD